MKNVPWAEEKVYWRIKKKKEIVDLSAINCTADPGIVADLQSVKNRITPFFFTYARSLLCFFPVLPPFGNVHCVPARWSLMSDIRFRFSEQSLVLAGNAGTSLSWQRLRLLCALSLFENRAVDRDTQRNVSKNVIARATLYEWCPVIMHSLCFLRTET